MNTKKSMVLQGKTLSKYISSKEDTCFYSSQTLETSTSVNETRAKTKWGGRGGVNDVIQREKCFHLQKELKKSPKPCSINVHLESRRVFIENDHFNSTQP